MAVTFVRLASISRERLPECSRGRVPVRFFMFSLTVVLQNGKVRSLAISIITYQKATAVPYTSHVRSCLLLTVAIAISSRACLGVSVFFFFF